MIQNSLVCIPFFGLAFACIYGGLLIGPYRIGNNNLCITIPAYCILGYVGFKSVFWGIGAYFMEDIFKLVDERTSWRRWKILLTFDSLAF